MAMEKQCFPTPTPADQMEQQVKKNAFGKQGKRLIQYNDINDVLIQIRSKLIEIFNNATTPPDKNFIASELDNVCKKIITLIPEDESEDKSKDESKDEDEKDIFYYYDIYIKNAKVTSARLRSIKSYKNHLYKFSKSKKITLTFDTFTADKLRDFEKYLRKDKIPKGDNTIKAIMSSIRTFWNYSVSNFEHLNIPYPFSKSNNDKGYVIPKEKYGDPIFLTIEERDLIFNANIESNRLSTIRDIFVFQCLIGARVGDLLYLTKDNVDKNNVLSYIPSKTINKAQSIARIPLTAKAIEILNKYDMPDNRLLPFITDQKYNEYLKELFKLIGLDRKVEVLNTITKKKEHISICDIASSHLARRTFVGNLVNKKTPLHVVTKMSGHVAGSKSVQRYYSVNDDILKDYVDLID
jgi:integrase